jgi:uncharacterized protein YfaP (DUF2135 family)
MAIRSPVMKNRVRWVSAFVTPLALIACVQSVGEADHPCPCSAGWTCCAPAANVCVTAGAACPTDADGSTAKVDGGSPGSFVCEHWSLTEVGQPGASEPFNIAIGDINGDHLPDLAVGAEDGIDLLSGDGKGGFASLGALLGGPGGGIAQGLGMGDFDQDGKLDLVVALERSVEVLAGNGDGTFQTPVAYGLGDAGDAVTVGDVNGDGKPDILVAILGGNAMVANSVGGVAVLLNKGDGTFQPAISYPAGPMPESVALGDLNGDGKVDLAVADANLPGPTGSVSVLLGNGDGTFSSPVAFATGAVSTSVAVGDLNGDGKLDLAVANQGTSNVSVLLGRGDGTFGPQVTYPTDSAPVALALRDMNGDGHLDVVVANSASNDVSVLLGRGDGTFQDEAIVATGTHPYALAIDDLNADGKPDVAVVNGESSSVSILLDTCGP